MPGSWTTLAILDGGGTSRTMRAWDESGAGAGPFSFGQIIADGSGASGPAVKAGNEAPTTGDPYMVVGLAPSSMNSNGQQIMDDSAPVTIASDQSPIPVAAKSLLWNAGTSNDGLLAAAFSAMTTELNSLADSAVIVSSVGGTSGLFKNSTTGQAQWGELFLTLGAIGSALEVGACLAGWFLTTPDAGATMESTTAVPSRSPDFTVGLPATTIGAASVFKALVNLPALNFKLLILNQTGQPLASSGNSVKIAPVAQLG